MADLPWVKGKARTVSTQLLDATDDPVNPATVNVLVSKDGAAGVAATNDPATDVGSGLDGNFSILITADEMDADHVKIIFSGVGANAISEGFKMLTGRGAMNLT